MSDFDQEHRTEKLIQHMAELRDSPLRKEDWGNEYLKVEKEIKIVSVIRKL